MSKLSDKLSASVRKAQSDTGNKRVAVSVSAPPVAPPRSQAAKPAPSAAPKPAATAANAPSPSPEPAPSAAPAVTAAPRPFGFPDRVWPD